MENKTINLKQIQDIKLWSEGLPDVFLCLKRWRKNSPKHKLIHPNDWICFLKFFEWSFCPVVGGHLTFERVTKPFQKRHKELPGSRSFKSFLRTFCETYEAPVHSRKIPNESNGIILLVIESIVNISEVWALKHDVWKMFPFPFGIVTLFNWQTQNAKKLRTAENKVSVIGKNGSNHSCECMYDQQKSLHYLKGHPT